MRWWNEFRSPELKCERVGHNWQTRYLTGYAKPWAVNQWTNGVAFDVEVEVPVCKRCATKNMESLVVLELHPIHSLSLPSDWFKILNKTGWFFPRY